MSGRHLREGGRSGSRALAVNPRRSLTRCQHRRRRSRLAGSLVATRSFQHNDQPFANRHLWIPSSHLPLWSRNGPASWRTAGPAGSRRRLRSLDPLYESELTSPSAGKAWLAWPAVRQVHTNVTKARLVAQCGVQIFLPRFASLSTHVCQRMQKDVSDAIGINEMAGLWVSRSWKFRLVQPAPMVGNNDMINLATDRDGISRRSIAWQ